MTTNTNQITTNRPLRCAVIGVGYLGKFHAEKYAKLDNAELIGVCDIDLETAQNIASKYDVAIYQDYRYLLGKVDAVSLAPPTSQHFEIAKFFIENGVHVLIEKPITATLKTAKEILDLNEKHPEVIVQVGLLERLNSAFVALKQASNKPLFIEARRLTSFRNRAYDVSVIVDLMIHDIDLTLQIAKSPIKAIDAHGYKIFTDYIDFAHAKISFENGIIANLTASRATSPDSAERTMHVVEPNGYIQADFVAKTLCQQIFPDDQKPPYTKDDVKNETLDLVKNDAIMDEIKAFLHSIQNKEEPIVSAKVATNSLAIAMEIEKLATKNGTAKSNH